MSKSATNSLSAETNLDNGKNSKKTKIQKSFTDFETIKEYAVYLKNELGWNHLNSERWILRTEQILKLLELETRYDYKQYAEALDEALDSLVISYFEYAPPKKTAQFNYECIKEFKKLFDTLSYCKVEDKVKLIDTYLFDYYSEENLVTQLTEAINCYVVKSFEDEMFGMDKATTYSALIFIKSILLELDKIETEYNNQNQ
jgi:hypothetical protein